MDVSDSVMSVLELCTSTTWLVEVVRLKSRGNSVMVSTGVWAALWVTLVLVPVIVIGYVPPGVLVEVKMLMVELNVGIPLGFVNE